MEDLKIGDIIKERYTLMRFLGSGSFGEVWLAHDQMTGRDVALKIYLSLDPAGVEEFRREYSNTADLSGLYLLTPEYFDVHNRRPFLVMKFCKDGSASKLAGQISEDKLWAFIHDVAAGLEVLHSQSAPIVHQDIKPDNILIDSNGHFLITDFGISKRLRSTMRRQSKRDVSSGSMPYMAPERFDSIPKLSPASDIWSLGASIYELATGELPLNGFGGTMLRHGAEIPLLMGDNYSKDVNDLMQACLSPNPTDRPTAAQIAEAANSRKYPCDNNTKATVNVHTSKESIREPVEKRSLWTRYKWVVSGAAVALGAVVGFMLFHDRPVADMFEMVRADESRVVDSGLFGSVADMFEMVRVEGGTFTMGAAASDSEAYDNERPAHSVTLSGYYIGKYEVTQKQWVEIMGRNPSHFKGDNLPVECVSWNDVQEFISRLNARSGRNFRLPTEAEWEYAARGGNRSRGYKYSGSDNISDVAWNYVNSNEKTHLVGTKRPNELGICDMTGNVWEWCSDWHGSYGSSSCTNPKGPSSGTYRVRRGGSWDFSFAGSCRVSFRDGYYPHGSHNDIGFRLAESLVSEQKRDEPVAPQVGTVRITSNIYGATVFIGNMRGTTPCTFEAEPGDYMVTVQAAGYDTENRQVKIVAGQNRSEYITLNAKTKSVSNKAKPVADKTQNLLADMFEMVRVEGGTFTMGAAASDSEAYDVERPAHSVTLSGYYIGKYEVTQKQWVEIMGRNPSHFKGDNLPVECVSWNDVQEFISRLNARSGRNFRLPTEAEWEYAARGGNRSRGYKYSGSYNIYDVAWHNRNSNEETHPVGTKRPNELGIYDMTGNVWEWCSDWHGSYGSSSCTNPKGPSSGTYRVLRGGGCHSLTGFCRVSNRDSDHPDGMSYYRGFRLALSL